MTIQLKALRTTQRDLNALLCRIWIKSALGGGRGDGEGRRMTGE